MELKGKKIEKKKVLKEDCKELTLNTHLLYHPIIILCDCIAPDM